MTVDYCDAKCDDCTEEQHAVAACAGAANCKEECDCDACVAARGGAGH